MCVCVCVCVCVVMLICTHIFTSINAENMLYGSLSPRHGASSSFGWRKRPPDMEGSYEYIEWADTNSRQRVFLQLGGWARSWQLLTGIDQLVTKCYTGTRTWTVFRELKWEGVDGIHLAQDREQWRTLVKTVMNLRVPLKARNFFTSWVTMSFSGRTPLHGVSLFFWHHTP
jgi:hypothetical protein